MVLFDLYINLDIFVLVLLRVTGFIFTSPLFGQKEIPSIVKISFSVFFAYILIVSQVPVMETQPQSILAFTFICINEIMRMQI